MSFFLALLSLMKLDYLDDAQTEAIKQASNASGQSHLITKTQATSVVVFVGTGIGFEGAIGFIALVGRVTSWKYGKIKRRIFFTLVKNRATNITYSFTMWESMGMVFCSTACRSML